MCVCEGGRETDRQRKRLKEKKTKEWFSVTVTAQQVRGDLLMAVMLGLRGIGKNPSRRGLEKAICNGEAERERPC